jgi:hypothetical protein
VYYHDVIEAAGDMGIELGPEINSIPEIVMTVFRRTHALWLHAASEVDRLDPDKTPGLPGSLWTIRYDESGNRIVEQSKWILAEKALREELFDQAMRMSHLKLDERLVAVEEATLSLIAAALATAVSKADIPEDTQRAIGKYFREELQTIDGTATATGADTPVPATAGDATASEAKAA